MSTLRAVRMHDDGGPDVLQMADALRPCPGADEVEVWIQATGMNPLDGRLRETLRPGVPFTVPAFRGLDFSGVVEAVGAHVRSFRPGDEVFGRTEPVCEASYGDYVTVPAGRIVHKPRRIDHLHAAAVPTAALTAWQALLDAPDPARCARLARGQTVLVHGAAGGVGSFGVQLARLHDARVIATAAGRHADFVLGLGADVFIDPARQRFEEVARQVDVVLDTVGGDLQARSWAVLRPGGVLVTTAGLGRDGARRTDVRAFEAWAPVDTLLLQKIAALIEYGALHVPATRMLSLDEAASTAGDGRRGPVDGGFALSAAG